MGKKVRWIVPHGAGGAHDTYSRVIAPFYEAAFGVEVVVENVDGAGGRIGASRLSGSRPDGLTIGLVNGPGLLVAALLGERGAPRLGSDVAVLARVAPIYHLWLAAADSPLRTFDDVRTMARQRPIVFGLRDVGSASLIDSVAGSWLLDLPMEFVSGYSGTSARLLALQRGEIDIVTVSLEAGWGAVEDGLVRPLLQIWDGPAVDYPELDGVPWLGGRDGLASSAADDRGGDVAKAEAQAEALIRVLSAGRLIVAPPGLEPQLFACLEAGLYEVLDDPRLRAAAEAAGLSWAPERAEAVQQELAVAAEGARWFLPLVAKTVRRIRE